MKKILYHFRKKPEFRVFEPFKKRNDVEQLILTPGLPIKSKTNLPCFSYSNGDVLKTLLKQHRPDVIVRCENSKNAIKLASKFSMKVVFVGHGIWDKSPTNAGRARNNNWNKYDLLSCGIPMSREIIMENNPDIPFDRFVVNALPQFDVLFDRVKNSDQHKVNILGDLSNRKVMVMFGHKYNKYSFLENDKDFFESLVVLAKMAHEKDWVLLIKEKKGNTLKFLRNMAKKKDWAVKAWRELRKVFDGKIVRFVKAEEDPYKYMAIADAVVISARSTIEIETCMAGKPLVVVRTIENDSAGGIDTLGTISAGCAYHIEDIDTLEGVMDQIINTGNEKTSNQEKFIYEQGLTFDGLHHKRLVDAILNILE